jgi:hypothetical protein
VGLYIVLTSCFFAILPMQAVILWIYGRKAFFLSFFLSIDHVERKVLKYG